MTEDFIDRLRDQFDQAPASMKRSVYRDARPHLRDAYEKLWNRVWHGVPASRRKPLVESVM